MYLLAMRSVVRDRGLFFFFLVLLFMAGVGSVYAFQLNPPECASVGQFTILHNRRVTLTCSGVSPNFNIYWSLRRPSSGETTLGECRTCRGTGCYRCAADVAGYSLARTSTETTVQFTAKIATHDGAVIKCSRSNNQASVTCRLRVLPRYVFNLAECTNDLITVVENQQASITCEGMTYQQQLYWATRGVTSNGWDQLGLCGTCPQIPCPACHEVRQNYSLSRTPTTAVLEFVADYESHEGVDVVCSTSDYKTMKICELKVVRDYVLPQCQHGRLDLVEDAVPAPSVTCSRLTADQTMGWLHSSSEDGSLEPLAACSSCAQKRCPHRCTAFNDDVIVSRTDADSTLTVIRNVRALAGRALTCRRDEKVQASCLVRVLRHGQLSEPRVTLDTNWIVTGSVTFSQAYSSDGHVECRWYRRHDNGQVESVPSSEITTIKHEENIEGRQFFGGSCVMVTLLNTTSEGMYNFSVELSPGDQRMSAGAVQIVKPGTLRAEKSSCPVVVAEGHNISCRCRYPSASKPFPPALLTWVNTTGARSDVLELHNVSRELSGRVHECVSRWGAGGEWMATVRYAVEVVYGPAHVAVTADETPTDDLDPVTLTCQVQEVSPSALFHWSVNCTNSSHTSVNSTCTVQRGWLNDVKEVECLAVNSRLEALNLTAIFVPSTREKQRQGGQATDEPPPQIAIIAGAAAGVVVTVLVVIVIVVVIVTRRKKNANKPSKTSKNDSRNDNDDFVEYVNDFYESSDDLAPSDNGPQTNTSPDSGTTTSSSSTSPITSAPLYDSPTSARAAPSPPSGNQYYNVTIQKSTNGNAVVFGKSASGISEESARAAGDVYAQVQKKPKKKSQDGNVQGETEPTVISNVYAQVQKKKKTKTRGTGEEEGKADDPQTAGDRQPPAGKDGPGEDLVYANWEPKGDDCGDLYMNMNMGQLSSEPSSARQGDEYNKLRFHRASTEEPNPMYNHLNTL